MLSSFMKFVSGKWSNVNVSASNPLPVNIIGGGNDLSVLIVEDSTNTKYLRREVIDEFGVITISYENFDGSAATPIAPITVASTVLPIGASTSAKQDELRGTQGTGASYDPPTGGSGLFGWMSGIYKEIISGIKLKLGGADVSSSNPLPVAQTDGLSVSGTATSAAVLFTTSMLNYESITVQVTSAGTSCTITYETSDDGVSNWVSTGGLVVNNTGQNLLSTTSTATGMSQFARKGLYFRARVSTYGSGIVTVIGTLSKVPVTQFSGVYTYGTGSEGGVVISNITPVGVEARTSSKTTVSSGNFVRPISTTDGRLVTRQNSIPENEWQYAAASGGIVNTADNVLIGAAGTNIKNYLTGLSVANADLRATEIVIKDGASTVIWRMYLAANAPIKSIIFSTPLQSSANSALNVACITTGTQTYINAQGYRAP